MAGRNVGENAAEERRHQTPEKLDQPAALADFHHPQPQAHDADQAERNVEAGLGRVEQPVQYPREDIEVALQQLRQRRDKADEDEGDPDSIEHGRTMAD